MEDTTTTVLHHPCLLTIRRLSLLPLWDLNIMEKSDSQYSIEWRVTGDFGMKRRSPRTRWCSIGLLLVVPNITCDLFVQQNVDAVVVGKAYR